MDANKIERVKVNTTLKCGNNVYLKGKIYDPPIPKDLIAEVKANTGTVEVLGVVFKETAPEPSTNNVELEQEELLKMIDDDPCVVIDGGEVIVEDTSDTKKRGRKRLID